MPISYKRIRIAFFDHTVSLSGGEKSLLQLMKVLDRNYFEPLLIVPGPGPLVKAAQSLDIPVRFLPFPKDLLRASRQFNFLKLPLYAKGLRQVSRALRVICKECKIQILHTNSLKTHVIGSFLNMPSVALIWHVRDILKFGGSWFLLRILAKIYPAKIICISHAVARQFGMSSKIVVVHNAVSFSKQAKLNIAGALERQIKALPKNSSRAPVFILICLGQIAYWKGQDIFIETIHILKQRGLAVLGLVVGDVMFPERENFFKSRLKLLVCQYRLQESVIFTGYQSSVEPWLKFSHLVLHCNRDPEPFGRVLVEAMLAQKVVITNTKVAANEVLAPALRPLQVPPENPLALANRVQELLLAPGRLKMLSASLKDWAKRKFSDRKMGDAIQRIYQEVLQ